MVTKRTISLYYLSALKYATFGGVFFWLIWLIDTIIDGKEISFYETLEKLLIFLALFTVPIFIQISFSLVNKKYQHPRLIRKIRSFPAFVELELVKKFRFDEGLCSFSGFYKGFELDLQLDLDEKSTEKMTLTTYVELNDYVKNWFTQKKKYEVTLFGDAISISRKLPIFQPYNFMEESLDAFIQDLDESGAKNKVFEIIEDEQE